MSNIMPNLSTDTKSKAAADNTKATILSVDCPKPGAACDHWNLINGKNWLRGIGSQGKAAPSLGGSFFL